ncbi:MAG: GntP family permease, partial [Desulfonatronovibrionaceae bacterium]
LGFGLASGMEPGKVVQNINTGFGQTIGEIGIVILAGTIIGIFLEKSGGARRIADSALRLTGKKNVPLALAITGYIVSLPVYCDSGYVILSPLNKVLTRRAGLSLATGTACLSLGLYVAHTMVPPTPGPIAAAGILSADLGLVIMLGLAVSAVALTASWLFAITYASRIEIAEPDSSGKEVSRHESCGPEDNSPPTILSLLPIILPLLLIMLGSMAQSPFNPFAQGLVYKWITFAGQPAVALLCGLGCALLLPSKLERRLLSSSGWVGQAIKSAGTILIITGAGGALGKVLQESGIADLLGSNLQFIQLGIFLPFILAAGIKTLQGSSTVAMITTAAMLAPLLDALGLGEETGKALAVVALGAGSMVVSHINDSYFWVVTQFSDMQVGQGCKVQTLGSLVAGLSAFAAIVALRGLLI